MPSCATWQLWQHATDLFFADFCTVQALPHLSFLPFGITKHASQQWHPCPFVAACKPALVCALLMNVNTTYNILLSLTPYNILLHFVNTEHHTAAGMMLGAVAVGVHMAMTHAICLSMLSAYIPATEVPGLGRVSGTVWSFTDFVLGKTASLTACLSASLLATLPASLSAVLPALLSAYAA